MNLVYARAQLARAPKVLTCIILGSVLVRILGFLWVYVHADLVPFTYSDSIGYLSLARTLWETHTFSSISNGVLVPEIYRTPGLPALLAPFATGTFLPLALYPVIMSVLVGIFLPLLSYLIAKRYLQELPALVVAGFCAFELNLVTYTWPFLTEAPFLLLSLGGVYLSIIGYEKRSWGHSTLGGFLLGLSLYMLLVN